MRPERQAELEQNGYQILKYSSLDPYWNTDTFIMTPDGHTLADYDNLSDIPVLDDNTMIGIDPVAFPYDDQIGFYCGQVDGGAIIHAGETASADSLVIPWFGWLAIVVVTSLLVTAVFMVTSAINPEPICASEPRQQDIGTCAKLIVMPNCDTRAFNPCTGEWIDSTWSEHGTMDWLWYIVLAVAGVAAIVIIPKVLGLFKGKIQLPGSSKEEAKSEENPGYG